MVKIYTDYKNFKSFISIKILNQRQIRWLEKLVSYNFRIQYRKGLENGKADTLSRKNNYFDEQVKEQTRPILIINNDGCIRYNYIEKSLLKIIKIVQFKSKKRLQRAKLTTTLKINNINIIDKLRKVVSENSFAIKLME